MSRCPGRPARWALRGALLCGGFVGAWGLYSAVAPDAAQAAEPARPGVVADLLGDVRTIVEEGVIAPLHLPTGSTAGSGAPDIGGGTTADPPRPAPVGQPVRPAVVALPRLDGAGVAEAITPVTRPVGDLTSPVLSKVASAPLVEPVVEAVRPVTEPIIELLPPVLAPVRDLTEPVLGGPEAPSAPPAGPIVGTPPPAGDAPTTGTPAPTVEAPTTGMPAVIARPAAPIVRVSPRATSPRQTYSPTGRDEASPGPASRSSQPGAPGHSPGLTPAAPASTAGAGAGAPGVPAEVSPRSWEPELQALGHCPTRSDELANRSSRPNPRPA